MTTSASIKQSLQKVAPEKITESSELLEKEPVEFASIQLNEFETELAIEAGLREARKVKYFQLKKEEYWKEVIKGDEDFKHFTAEGLSIQLKKTPISTDKEGNMQFFQIDDDNRAVVKLICYYFTNDKRFETEGGEGFSLKKGLLLQAGVGLGKSVLMALLQQNQKESFRVMSCIDVADTFVNQTKDDANSGRNVLNKFFGNLPSPLGSNPYNHRTIGYCFDDLGTETLRAMNFGTAKNTMEEVLWKRHSAGLFSSTHITTNLSADELKEAYGVRIYDRMREMFNQITWPATAASRRK